MTQAANAVFDAANRKLAKNVQYLMQFEGLPEKFVNKIGTIHDGIPLIVGTYDSLEQKLTDMKGRSTIGTIKVSLVDFKDTDGNYFMTKFLSANDLYGRNCTLSVGYVGIAEGDFLPVMTGKVADYSERDLEYTFVIEDQLRTLKETVFRDANDGNIITLRGNPIDLILQIMLSTGNGTNGIYDVLTSAQGLAIDQADVNVTEFERVRDNFIPKPNIEFRFRIKKPFKAIEFVEKQLYLPFNMHPIVQRDGRLSIVTNFPSLEIDDVVVFDKDIIIGKPDWDGGTGFLINEVEIQMDFDIDSGEYDTVKIFRDLSSVGRFNRVETFTIKSKGLHGANSPDGDLGGDVIANDMALTVLGLRSIPLPELDLDSLFFRQLTEVGDSAIVTHPLVPDLRRGTRGIVEEVFKVRNMKTVFDKGMVTITGLLTGFSGKKYGAISPSARVNADETPTTSVFAVNQNHGLLVGDAISVFTEEIEQETIITDIADSAGGGGGSNNKITVSPTMVRAPNINDVVQYSTFDFVDTNTLNDGQRNFAYFSEPAVSSTAIKSVPTPTASIFEVDDPSVLNPGDVIAIDHGTDSFIEFGIIFSLVDDRVELIVPLIKSPSGTETVTPEELEGGTKAFVFVPSVGVSI